MRTVIAGAGTVGQAIAHALIVDGHKVLLIERQRPHYRPHLVPEAEWMLADACELAALRAAAVETADVAIAATGDDKVNLVFALLCKTELAVVRVLARVNQPGNQWLFTTNWGVDIAVSTPDSLVAAVEEAVNASDIVRLMTLQHGHRDIIQVTLHAEANVIGRAFADLKPPADTTLIAIRREDALLPATPDLVIHPGDKIILLAARDLNDQAREQLLHTL